LPRSPSALRQSDEAGGRMIISARRIVTSQEGGERIIGCRKRGGGEKGKRSGVRCVTSPARVMFFNEPWVLKNIDERTWKKEGS